VGALINFFSFLCVGEFKQFHGLVFLGNLQIQILSTTTRKKEKEKQAFDFDLQLFFFLPLPRCKAVVVKLVAYT
jgi:hypothetical protein